MLNMTRCDRVQNTRPGPARPVFCPRSQNDKIQVKRR